jgi:hypothetical protein
MTNQAPAQPASGTRPRPGPAERGHTEKEIEEAFLSHPFGEVLASMPGIGPRTGARILAEIGDSADFASGAKLAAYAGLAPVTRQSGASLNCHVAVSPEALAGDDAGVSHVPCQAVLALAGFARFPCP